MGFFSVLKDLKVSMLYANQRVTQHATAGVTELFMLALLVVLIGSVLAFLSGDYHAGFESMHPITNAVLPDAVWAWITRLGDERVVVALSLIFARRRPEILWAMVVATIVGVAYSRGLKFYVDALRPPAVLSLDDIHLIGPTLTAHSFPSGHTLTAFLFAGVLFAFCKSWQERLLLMVVAVLVGVSRVALGVHWPQDVLAGAFGGLLAAGFGVWISFYWRAGLKPMVHLSLMILPLIGMVTLLLSDNGNPSTPMLVYPLVFAMACQMLLDYRSYK